MSNLVLQYLADNPRLYTEVGSKQGNFIILDRCLAGCGFYGPYVNLPRGRYYASVRFATGGRLEGCGVIDVCSGNVAQIVISAPFDLGKLIRGVKEIGIAFDLPLAVTQCQVRLQCAAGVSARIECLVIEFRDLATPAIEAAVGDGLGDRAVAAPFVRGSLIRQVKRLLHHPLAETRWRVKATLARKLPKRVEAILARELSGRVEAILASELSHHIEDAVDRALATKQARFYRPNDIVAGSTDGEYMVASNALARDFLHPEFQRFCRIVNEPVRLHRKLWEWAFIYERLRKMGVLRPGTHGLVFGVGTEPLPAVFASLGAHITATDAPVGQNWVSSSNPSDHRNRLFHPDKIDRESFVDRVAFEYCDMNDIPSHLINYDFCWSSCSFEHLGSIEQGIDFVISSVERSLKIGGVACHTTELNLSSNDETIETGGTVIYRKKDLERLCRMLEERGHWVEPLRIEPGTLPPDYFVDVPPYLSDPHLKLLIESYVATSVGIVARRGR
jgi:hypothetical protein